LVNSKANHPALHVQYEGVDFQHSVRSWLWGSHCSF